MHFEQKRTNMAKFTYVNGVLHRRKILQVIDEKGDIRQEIHDTKVAQHSEHKTVKGVQWDPYVPKSLSYEDGKVYQTQLRLVIEDNEVKHGKVKRRIDGQTHFMMRPYQLGDRQCHSYPFSSRKGQVLGPAKQEKEIVAPKPLVIDWDGTKVTLEKNGSSIIIRM